MKEIVFVTSNKGKIASAERNLRGIKVNGYDADLIEPRSDDVVEIAVKKVLQAYEVVGKPCISLDAGLFINSLNGFPRAYVNHMLDTIGIEGLVKLMEEKEDRQCEFRECLAYYDGKNLQTFESKTIGDIASSISEKNNEKKWSKLWNVFIPDGFDKQLCEFDENEMKKYDNIKGKTSMKKFAEWYIDNDLEIGG